MTPVSLLRALALAMFVAILSRGALAGPGAHGPDGEHLDGPAVNAGAASSRPRVEAASDQFELVATLAAQEFSMLIDRFATNEPVLGAQVEVESGGLKAKAVFQADIGSYAVADAALLKLLGMPGDHGLVFTIIDGNESDLLDATLKVAADEAPDSHSHGGAFIGGKFWIGAAVLATLLIGIAVWRRRTRTAKTWQGGQP